MGARQLTAASGTRDAGKHPVAGATHELRTFRAVWNVTTRH